MVWKIFFVLTFLYTFLVSLFGYLKPTALSSLEYILGLFVMVGIAFVSGVFYSLGWKQQIFSKKSINIFASVFFVGLLLFFVNSTMHVYPEVYNQVQNVTIAIISCAIACIIFAVIVNLLLIPLYIGLCKYNKNFDNLMSVEKPYGKLLSLYCVPVLASFVVAGLTKYSHYGAYNFFDFFSIFSCVYEILFLIGFSWGVKIFNKLFWQITVIPYTLLIIFSPFYKSNMFDQDFRIKEMLSDPVLIISSVALNLVFIYILSKYAFSKTEQVKTEE